LNEKVVEVNPDNNTVTTTSGRTEAYDKLVLATGSYPFVPPIPGKDQPHCLVYRTIEDLEAITDSARESKIGVVVGGGLLGLEAANALKHLGLETHVVEFAPRLMAVQLDEGGGELLRRKIEALGVQVHTGKNTTEIVAGETCRYRMIFADGSHLETDMILFSAGIRPQDELARQCNLALGERGGIVINNFCQTSVDNIYAIGECALWDNKIFGLVAPGYQMAQVAAAQIAGRGHRWTELFDPNRVRARASATRLVSMVIHRRPHCSATTEVEPDPHVGSRTRSPGSVVMSRQRSTALSAVWTT
jgi:nitrite reductase (NADH) large subunit